MRRVGLILAGLTLVVIGLSVTMGGAVIAGPSDVFAVDSQVGRFLWTFRIPRLVLGLKVGAGLAVSGALMQTLLRNDLAEPSIVGTQAGAGLGVILATGLFGGAGGPLTLVGMACLGGAITTAVVFALSWQRGGIIPVQFLLSGLGITMLVSLLSSIIAVTLRDWEHANAIAWMAGALGEATWAHLRFQVPVLVGLLGCAWLAASALDLLALEDRTSAGLGLAVGRSRALLLVLATALCCVCVAFGGGIAFVGLVAPHIGRRIVGPMHRRLLPVAAVIGALLVAAADLVGRTVFLPSLLPTGVVVACIAVPWFLFLLVRQRG